MIEQVEKAAEAAPQVADDLDIADLETGEAVPVKDQPEVQVRKGRPSMADPRITQGVVGKKLWRPDRSISRWKAGNFLEGACTSCKLEEGEGASRQRHTYFAH